MRDFARKNMVKTVCKLTKSVRKAMRAIQMMYFFGVIGYNSPDPSRLRARSARVCLRQTQKRAGVSDHLPNTLLPQFRSSKIAADATLYITHRNFEIDFLLSYNVGRPLILKVLLS